MQTADLLLLLIPRAVTAQVPGKLFEYLAVGRTILALAAADSEVARIVHQANAGFTVPLEADEEILSLLARLYEMWQQGALHSRPDPQVVQAYSRRELAGQLADLLEKITG